MIRITAGIAAVGPRVEEVFNCSGLPEGSGELRNVVPLYQAKAEFFRMLGHPVRIRVLELLGEGPMTVRDLRNEIDIEPSSLSQQLAVLRRTGIVTSTRDGSAVVYALAGPDVADLMRAARRILTEMLAGQAELLDTLRHADATDRDTTETNDADEPAHPVLA